VPERYLGQTLGKYRIESLLGSGGFAWVFKGYDPELDIPVAIKVLKPQFAGDQAVVDRFKREASTAAKLRHPNIIKIYAVGKEQEAVYFVMDYLPSGLANRLETTQSLPEDYVLRVGVDVARALGFAHREGVIHRDIKVDNILFDTHGNAVVADFGIARALSGYTNQTGTNMVVGTPQYFAPEQARAKPLDGRADLYSLGVTLFRAATGRLPFEGEDWYEIARQHVEEPPPLARSVNPALSPEFESIVLSCMAKSPDERPATGDALAEHIQSLLTIRKDPSSANTVTVPSTPGSITPHTNGRPVARPVTKRRLWLGALLATIVVATVATILASPFGVPVVPTKTGTDTLTPDTISSNPDSIPGVGPVPVNSLPPGKTTPGRSSTPTTPGTRSTVGSIVVSAPADAQVFIGDQEAGFGQSRRDSLSPGSYLVRAVLPAIDGCTVNRDSANVTVVAGRVTTLRSLTPKLCGTVVLKARGSDPRNQPVSRELWYALQPEGQAEPPEQPLPTEGLTKVVPVGKYLLHIRMRMCTPYDETPAFELFAGETITRTAIVLICP
jgi:eukaryotic-like serine/threonine-protein kinase